MKLLKFLFPIIGHSFQRSYHCDFCGVHIEKTQEYFQEFKKIELEQQERFAQIEDCKEHTIYPDWPLLIDNTKRFRAHTGFIHPDNLDAR